MKILKEGGLIDEVILSFRYVFESEKPFIAVMEELTQLGVVFESYQPSKRVSTFRIIIDEIQEDFFDPNAIKAINSKLEIPGHCYDFFLGITSRFDIGGFSIPQKVIEAIGLIGGKVEISYAVS